MGGYGSGRRRQKRTQIEECERRRGEACPQCGRAVKWLYEPPGGAAACVICTRAIYRSQAEYSTVAAKIRKQPELIGEALDKAEQWVRDVPQGTANAKNWSTFMPIIEAAGTPARDALTSDILKDARIPDDATLQERVIASDIARATELLDKIETVLNDGHENHVDRSGIPSRVPLRVDSMSKLIHAFCALSNLRATRAGVATSINETRNAGKTRENSLNVQEILADPEATAAAMLLSNKMFGTKQLKNED